MLDDVANALGRWNGTLQLISEIQWVAKAARSSVECRDWIAIAQYFFFVACGEMPEQLLAGLALVVDARFHRTNRALDNLHQRQPNLQALLPHASKRQPKISH